jgi:hypothetical protein
MVILLNCKKTILIKRVTLLPHKKSLNIKTLGRLKIDKINQRIALTKG